MGESGRSKSSALGGINWGGGKARTRFVCRVFVSIPRLFHSQD